MRGGTSGIPPRSKGRRIGCVQADINLSGADAPADGVDDAERGREKKTRDDGR